ICLKCLAKEPPRRYSSAEALADDLERWLAGEPIRARRSSPAERAWKWARRRPALAVLVVTSALLALGGLTGVLSQWLRAEWALEAEKEQEQAKDAALQHKEAALKAEERERRAKEAALEEKTKQFLRSEDHLHALRMVVAGREWQDSHVVHVEQILRDCRPEL